MKHTNRLILTHEGIDFDALASAVAAKKLYGDGMIISTGKKHDNVLMFLKLYRKYFSVERYSSIEKFSEIDEIIITDTAKRRRLGKLAAILDKTDAKITVYDHHPSYDIIGNYNYHEEVGAITTFLVEKLIENGNPINHIEADLFLLGIYEDTGSLLYPTTTARDMKIAAKLLECGGKLEIVSSYLNREFTEQQKKLAQTIVANMETHIINDIPITISTATLDETIGGISDVVNKIHYLENLKASFVIIKMGRRIHIVGRTGLNSLNINKIMSFFNGGGHVKAGSATLFDKSIEEVKFLLLEVLENNIKPILTAFDIMSHPVFTLFEDERIGDVIEKIDFSVYLNYPVLNRDGKLTGWVNKKKILELSDKGKLNVPLKGILQKNIVFVNKNTPFEKIEETFLEKNVSIIIVGTEKNIDGIITPTDVVRILHMK